MTVYSPGMGHPIGTETNEFEARGEFVIFFTNSLSNCIGWAMAVNVEKGAEAANPAPPVCFPPFLFPPAERGTGKGCRLVRPTSGAGGGIGRDQGIEELTFFFFLTSSVDSHRDPLPVVCSPPAKSRS